MISVWILVSYVSYHSGFQYSPQIATKESCEEIKVLAKKANSAGFFECIKLTVNK